MKKIGTILVLLLGIIVLIISTGKEAETKVLVNGNVKLDNSSFYKTNSEYANLIEEDYLKEQDIIIKGKNTNNNENTNKNVITNNNEHNYVSDNDKDNMTSSDINKETMNSIKEENNDSIKSSAEVDKENKEEANNNVAKEEPKEEIKKEIEEEKNLETEEKDKPKKVIPKSETTLKVESTQSLVILVDKSGNYCAQALDYFYEDAQYIYYFTCKKSGSMYVIKNGKEYKLVEALKTGVTSIKELEDNGYSFPKKEKNYAVK